MRKPLDVSSFGPLYAALIAIGLSPAIAWSPARADFVTGDLYVLSQAAPGITQGILRIDPLTGDTSVLIDIDDAPQLRPTFSYDPYRDRLIYADATAGGNLFAVDDQGNRSNLAPGIGAMKVAARGDGVLYLWGNAGSTFRYLDALDAVHDLLDESGLAAFQLEGSFEELIYEPETGSLIVLTGQRNGAVPICELPAAACAIRIPLSEDGNQVVGPLQHAVVDISSIWYSLEVVVGSGRFGDSGIFFAVDTNTNEQEARMQVLDVATMTLATYAANGPYIGVAGMMTGTYSNLRGQAVVHRGTVDDLLVYGQGEGGEGTVLANDVGYPLRIVEIRPAATGLPGAAESAAGTRLEPVWPNPLRGAAVVRFTLAAAGLARVTIYNAAGRHVRRLAVGGRPAGPQELIWDRRDDAGRALPSGLYLVELEAAGRTQAQKVVLLR